MELVISHVYAQNANGGYRSISGGQDLRQALNLKKQGLAKVKFLGTKFVGYGRNIDVGYSCKSYKVSFL